MTNANDLPFVNETSRVANPVDLENLSQNVSDTRVVHRSGKGADLSKISLHWLCVDTELTFPESKVWRTQSEINILLQGRVDIQ